MNGKDREVRPDARHGPARRLWGHEQPLVAAGNKVAPEGAYAALVSMNAISVGTLSIFLGIVFSGLYAGAGRRTP